MFGKEKFFTNNFYTEFSKMTKINRNVQFFSILPRIWLELVIISALSILIIILIFKNYEISQILTTIAIFLVAAFRLMPSANRLLSAIQDIRSSTPARNLVIDEFKKHTIKLNTYDESYNFSDDVAIEFKKNIVLKDLSYKYPNNKHYTFKKINLNIAKGSTIGLVGTSGVGNSTLVDLLIGLLPISEGIIKVDNKEIVTSSRSWKSLIGYVSQSIYLIDDTIENNIAFGLEKGKIDNEAINYAVKASQLNEFINSLPNKIHTSVGERGVRLSGGQRQRISLARALYLNPPILVLDEATSSLDNNTENEVMSSIRKLKGHKTIIIIAHRLTTLENCDEIYELKNGQLNKK